MRILLVGASALALSGCSWLGLSGHNHNNTYNNQAGYQHAQHPAKQTSCKSQHCLSRWNVEAAIGTEFIVGGKARKGVELPNEFVLDNADVKMKQAFEDGYRAELGGSYALSPNRKITATGFYSHAEGGKNLPAGTLNGAELQVDYSDYKSYGAELGLRQYMHPQSAPVLRSIRPYVEGKIGGAYVEDISFRSSDGTGSSRRQYKGAWAPTAAGLIGVETPVLRQMTLGLESGVRYTGKMKSDTSSIGPIAVSAGANNNGDRWTIPVMLRGRYRF